MDARRGSRYVVDPKVRHVGFITPASTEPLREVPAEPISSPVIVIPPPPTIDVLPKASPMPVPSPSPRKLPTAADDIMPLGSYNPTDSLFDASPEQSKSDKHDSNGGYMSIPSDNMSVPSFSCTKKFEAMSVREEDDLRDMSAKFAVSFVASDNMSEPSFSCMKKFEAVSVREEDDLRDISSVAKLAVSFVASTALEPLASFQQRQQQPEIVAPSSLPTNASNLPFTAPAASIAGGGIVSGNIQKRNKAPKNQPARKGNVPEKKAPSVGEKKGGEKGPEKEKKREVPAPRMQFDDEHRVTKAKKRSLVDQTMARNRVELFRHLPQFVYGTQLPSLEAKFFQDDPLHPHPAMYRVGLQYVSGDIVGGNARCIAMLLAFREFFKDYNTPKEKTLVRDLMAKINSHVSFLITCRPLSVSMGNAIRFLKARVAKLPNNLSEAEAKASLISEIDCFIQEKIIFVDKEITKYAVTKIRDGDVILTYAFSCVVEMILFHAVELGKNFRVIVVDSRPRLEGKRLLRRLLGRGISCTYTDINAVSYIMQEVTRVFLGAASVLSNGTVYSRVGTACVAMVAHAFHVPVLICCETYKFHERVQLDSICSNELGDPDALSKVVGREDLPELEGWADNKNLQLLNLTYDTTPSEYVSMIITELGMVPPTSVPAILREHRRDPLLLRSATG